MTDDFQTIKSMKVFFSKYDQIRKLKNFVFCAISLTYISPMSHFYTYNLWLSDVFRVYRNVILDQNGLRGLVLASGNCFVHVYMKLCLRKRTDCLKFTNLKTLLGGIILTSLSYTGYFPVD